MTKTPKVFRLSRFIFDLMIDVVVVIALVIFIRYFLFAPFRVSGPSMCDTFNNYEGECYTGDGELVLASRLQIHSFLKFLPFDLVRGDVIIFKAPASENGEFFIKRIIGLEGDVIKIADGLVYLQDESGEFVELKEDYLNEDNAGNTFPHRLTEAIYEVPEDSYLVFGDNRTKSSDSRRCFKHLGCGSDGSPYLEKNLIEGEVKVVIFPLNHIRWVGKTEY